MAARARPRRPCRCPVFPSALPGIAIRCRGAPARAGICRRSAPTVAGAAPVVLARVAGPDLATRLARSRAKPVDLCEPGVSGRPRSPRGRQPPAPPPRRAPLRPSAPPHRRPRRSPMRAGAAPSRRGRGSTAAAADSERQGTFKDCAECPIMVQISRRELSRWERRAAIPTAAPAHHVAIRSFALAQRPMTVAEWKACAAVGGCPMCANATAMAGRRCTI